MILYLCISPLLPLFVMWLFLSVPLVISLFRECLLFVPSFVRYFILAISLWVRFVRYFFLYVCLYVVRFFVLSSFIYLCSGLFMYVCLSFVLSVWVSFFR